MNKTFFIAALFICSVGKSQQERQILLQNVIFNGLTAGIGASINHHTGEKWHKAFKRGFLQGSLGGVIIYGGKKLNYLITDKESLAYGWLAKVTHATGTSISWNGANNEKFGTLWSLELGPIKADFSTKDNAVKFRFLPASIVAYALASKSGKFNLGATLSSGSVVFSKKDVTLGNLNRSGLAYGRAFVYAEKNQARYQIFAHENIHLFQYQEYQILTSWLKPIGKKIKTEKGWTNLLSKYVYPDIPYLFAAYEIAGRYPNPCYFRNWFEFESERLSTNAYVYRCR